MVLVERFAKPASTTFLYSKMAVFDAPVCLTRSAPHEGFSGQLVFYDVVESSTISKSSVLSCIAEAGGEVVLPDSIRLPEFRTWIAATNANQAVIDVMPITSICTVLKVRHAPKAIPSTLARRVGQSCPYNGARFRS